MDSVYVLLCGADTYRAEAALHGSLAMTHPAWNKKYALACTTVPGVDAVDRRVVEVCHAMVLCGGCVAAMHGRASYANRPVLALEEVADAPCVRDIQDAEFYYGSCSVAQLRTRLQRIALTPPHVLYDSLLQCLTPVGEAAFQRAFWLLDRNAEGVLGCDALLAWRRLVDAATATTTQLRRLLAPDHVSGDAAEGEGGSSETEQNADELTMRSDAFTALHLDWLRAGRVEDAWATLHVMGVQPDGLPYSWYDLHSLRVEPDMNTYLSSHGVQFFRGVYKLRYMTDPHRLWSITPGCPWHGMAGFRTTDIALDKFIEYWKYFALEHRETVMRYARLWGYRGDTGLLFLRRRCRAFRAPGETPPDTLHVLVTGSDGAGKHSLLRALTAEPSSTADDGDGAHGAAGEHYVRTTTFFVRRGAAEEPQTLLYTSVPAARAMAIVRTPALSRSIDLILVCLDGDEARVASSASCAVELCQATRDASQQPPPLLLVLTKAELTHTDGGAMGTGPEMQTLARLCRRHRLLWPPVRTSAERQAEGELGALNTYVYEVARNPDLAVAPPALTAVRVLRRLMLMAIIAVASVGVAQSATRWLRRAHRRT